MDTPRPAPARRNEPVAHRLSVHCFEEGMGDKLEMATACAIRTGSGVEKSRDMLAITLLFVVSISC